MNEETTGSCVECGEVIYGEFDECLACGEPMCDDCKLEHEHECE